MLVEKMPCGFDRMDKELCGGGARCCLIYTITLLLSYTKSVTQGSIHLPLHHSYSDSRTIAYPSLYLTPITANIDSIKA